jgi:peptidoglycan/xylan/chitin deacetylase (PgdA/CDA1 family)
MFKTSAILTYHSIDHSGSVISTPLEVFERQMEALAACGVPVVPLNRVTEVRPSLALTFDDGYANFAELVVPLLLRYNFPATVFVVSGHCGAGRAWPQPPFASLKMMSWETLRGLPEDLVSLGAHTISHPDLTTLAGTEAAEEIHGSRAELEDRTGRVVNSFAYPYGASNAAVRAEVRKGFRIACGTTLRFLSKVEDACDLPRIDTFYLCGTDRFQEFVSGRARRYLLLRRFLHGVHSGMMRCVH